LKGFEVPLEADKVPHAFSRSDPATLVRAVIGGDVFGKGAEIRRHAHELDLSTNLIDGDPFLLAE